MSFRSDGEIFIACHIVARFSNTDVSCSRCCFFDVNGLCAVANKATNCIGGHFEKVPPEEHTPEQRTELVTMRLMNVESDV